MGNSQRLRNTFFSYFFLRSCLPRDRDPWFAVRRRFIKMYLLQNMILQRIVYLFSIEPTLPAACADVYEYRQAKGTCTHPRPEYPILSAKHTIFDSIHIRLINSTRRVSFKIHASTGGKDLARYLSLVLVLFPKR